MSDTFRMTLGQLNATVGAVGANATKARAAWDSGRQAGADIVVLPEMFLGGYQLQDLVRRSAFLKDVERELLALAAACANGPALGIGAPLAEGGRLYNAYFILQNGKVAARVLKYNLPNEDVFDERRHFTPGPISGPCRVGPLRIGIPVCEDAWHPEVPETLAETGAEILFVPNGSPYRRGKLDLRMNVVVARVVETGLPLVYLNAVGGQDDQVFDGASFALNPGGALALQLPPMVEVIEHVDFARGVDGWRIVQGRMDPVPDAWEQDYHAMVLSLRDYLAKSGIGKVLLGLSGGVDSALVATIAVDAIGAANVRAVMLPSEFTSAESLSDALAVARTLGCHYDTVPIEGSRAATGHALGALFAGTTAGIAEENIQSRLRGLLLMAISNKFGEMLLTTGNKSEVAVGYATIYGDMAGGFNPIKDLYKTRVFETCRWRNANHRDWMKGPAGEVIPPRVIDKPPTAELRANQKDEDSLPPYAVLDAILERMIEGEQSVAEIVAAGFDRAVVKKVEGLVYGAEWKRHQSAPGTRLTTMAFWLDRRYPIVNRWRDES